MRVVYWRGPEVPPDVRPVFATVGGLLMFGEPQAGPVAANVRRWLVLMDRSRARRGARCLVSRVRLGPRWVEVCAVVATAGEGAWGWHGCAN